MKTLLLEIQDAVQKYANIISRVSGIDVEVADSNLHRIAGTGPFALKSGESVPIDGHVYRHVMQSGQVQIIETPGEHPLCVHCANRGDCKEVVAISKPIYLEDSCIGIIGLVGSLPEHKQRVLANKDMYLELLDQIAGFVAVNARDFQESAQKSSLMNTLDLAINNMSQAVLIIGEDHMITAANKAATEYFDSLKLVGEKIFLLATGDQLNQGNEYHIRIGSSTRSVFGSEHKISNPSNTHAKMLIFNDGQALLQQAYQMGYMGGQSDQSPIIGNSESTKVLKKEIEKASKSISTILISGESGTGKEVVAAAIWKSSSRKDKNFVTVNCAAIPEAFLEAELFGYVKGAFSGIDPNGRQGKFELAHQGILFLDEIADMPLHLQVKLLQVLQERKITRLGSNQHIPIDVRIIAATNQDLKQMIAVKKFREDLYYRLNVFPIRVSPLRNRLEDMEVLIHHFASYYAQRFQKKLTRIPPEVSRRLQTLPWKGNIRELENTVEFMVNMMEDDGILGLDILPKDFFASQEPMAKESSFQTLHELEEQAILEALNRFGNTVDGKRQAANQLGISLATLYRKLSEQK